MNTIEGQVKRKFNQETITSKKGSFKKQSFVIETLDSKYPKLVHITAWGDTTDFVSKLHKDTPVKVSYAVESREYNERWYTELKVIKIDYLDVEIPSKVSQKVNDDDLPF